MKRTKRKGRTTTFSVSVDAKTKALLKRVAKRSYGGNVSDLITQIAQQAARQDAAAELLASHGRSPMSDDQIEAFEREIERELSAQRPRRAS